jgi:hypothetical protein
MMPPLTADFVRELFDYNPDTGIFIRRKTGKPAGTKNKRTGHVTVWAKYKLEYAHRLAWLYHHGRYPTRNLRHKNGNKSDNRIANLTETTSWQSQTGRSARYTRVERTRAGNYAVRFQRNGHRYYLGTFDDPGVAELAYFVAALAYEDGCELTDRNPQDGR